MSETSLNAQTLPGQLPTVGRSIIGQNDSWIVRLIREPLQLNGSTTLVAQYCDMQGVRHYHIGRSPKRNPLANLTFCQKSDNCVVATTIQDSAPELPTGESIRDLLVDATPDKQILLTYDVPMCAPYEQDVRMFLEDVVKKVRSLILVGGNA